MESILIFPLCQEGIGRSGNLGRYLGLTNAFADLAKYFNAVLRMMRSRPRGTVSTPAVPLPASSSPDCRATDAAIMIAITEACFQDEQLSMDSDEDKVRLLLAAYLTAYGFTTAFAAVVGIPPLQWTSAYKDHLYTCLCSAHALGIQVMNVGITAQSFRSFAASSKTAAKAIIKKIINDLRSMHARAAKINPAILSEKGARWRLTKLLAGKCTPRAGYTMCHAVQLAVGLKIFGAKYRPALWEPIAFGGGTVASLSYLTKIEAARLSNSPALVRIVLDILKEKLRKKRGLAFLRNEDIYEVSVQICQWGKDSYSTEPCTHNIYRTGLTSKNASEADSSYLTKRQLSTLAKDAIDDVQAWKRKRISY